MNRENCCALLNCVGKVLEAGLDDSDSGEDVRPPRPHHRYHDEPYSSPRNPYAALPTSIPLEALPSPPCPSYQPHRESRAESHPAAGPSTNLPPTSPPTLSALGCHIATGDLELWHDITRSSNHQCVAQVTYERQGRNRVVLKINRVDERLSRSILSKVLLSYLTHVAGIGDGRRGLVEVLFMNVTDAESRELRREVYRKLGESREESLVVLRDARGRRERQAAQLLRDSWQANLIAEMLEEADKFPSTAHTELKLTEFEFDVIGDTGGYNFRIVLGE